MCLWVVTAAVLLPPLIMGIFAVLQKIKRDKDIDMKDEDFIVEISDSIISMGVMIDLVSAGIMVGFTIFTENLPPLIFYAVFVNIMNYFFMTSSTKIQIVINKYCVWNLKTMLQKKLMSFPFVKTD